MAAVGDAPPVAEESAFSAKYKVVESDQDAVTFGFEHQGPQTPIYDMCKLFLCCSGLSVSARREEGGADARMEGQGGGYPRHPPRIAT